MGNNYGVSITNHRAKNTIEIVMADDCDDVDDDHFSMKTVEVKKQLVLSHNSLSSIMSITSSTQTEPDLFTQWPKQKFMFKWLRKLRNYHKLLSKSHQLLYNAPLFFNSSSSSNSANHDLDVRCISLSTQTINKVFDHCIVTTNLMFVKSSFRATADENNSLMRRRSYASSSNCHTSTTDVSLCNGDSINMTANYRDFANDIQYNNCSNTVIDYNNPLFEKSDKDIFNTTNYRVNDSANSNYSNDNNLFDDTNNNGSFLNHEIKAFNNNCNISPVLSPRKKRQRIASNDSLISQLTNKYYKAEIISKKLSKSSDSLTSITWLSKPENTSLIFKSSGKSYKHRNKTRKMKRNIASDLDLNVYTKVGLHQNGTLSVDPKSHSSLSKKPRTRINRQSSLSIISDNVFDDSKSDFSGSVKEKVAGQKMSILSYKFWITSSNKNWDTFHNPTDRRIESIGRLSKCRIQLTNRICRHSDGLMKQQVIIYSPHHSALEKCCKLFDDKFPEFYASSGLLRVLYYRRDSGAICCLLSRYSNVEPAHCPVFVGSSGSATTTSRKKHSSSGKRRQRTVASKNIEPPPDLGFLRSELLYS